MPPKSRAQKLAVERQSTLSNTPARSNRQRRVKKALNAASTASGYESDDTAVATPNKRNSTSPYKPASTRKTGLVRSVVATSYENPLFKVKFDHGRMAADGLKSNVYQVSMARRTPGRVLVGGDGRKWTLNDIADSDDDETSYSKLEEASTASPMVQLKDREDDSASISTPDVTSSPQHQDEEYILHQNPAASFSSEPEDATVFSDSEAPSSLPELTPSGYETESSRGPARPYGTSDPTSSRAALCRIIIIVGAAHLMGVVSNDTLFMMPTAPDGTCENQSIFFGKGGGLRLINVIGLCAVVLAACTRMVLHIRYRFDTTTLATCVCCGICVWAYHSALELQDECKSNTEGYSARLGFIHFAVQSGLLGFLAILLIDRAEGSDDEVVA